MKRISSEISASSTRDIKKTEVYKNQVQLIREQAHQKYKELESKEKGTLKKLILKMQREAEIRKLIDELTSKDKLYMRIY